MARAWTVRLIRPVLDADHVLPEFADLKTPAFVSSVPAYIVAGVVGSRARASTRWFGQRPVLAAAQVPPELVVLWTPPAEVPAWRVAGVVGSRVTARMFKFVRPVLTAAQVSPESVDLKTPAVPA